MAISASDMQRFSGRLTQLLRTLGRGQLELLQGRTALGRALACEFIDGLVAIIEEVNNAFPKL